MDTGVLPISTSSTLTIAPGGFEEIVKRRCTHPHRMGTITSRTVQCEYIILSTETDREHGRGNEGTFNPSVCTAPIICGQNRSADKEKRRRSIDFFRATSYIDLGSPGSV